MTQQGASIVWVDERAAFPPAHHALLEPNGLLAASSIITPAMLEAAYIKGIFPWYARGQPVLWWSPDPRMVLVPEAFRISRSLDKILRKLDGDSGFAISMNVSFDRVMQSCAAPRDGQAGTWITPAVVQAYGHLHRKGLAHSVEVWLHDQLVGGLYGVAIGRMFYGESMFSKMSNASKIALAYCIAFLKKNDFPLVDCQQNTGHLASLGAREISRDQFLSHLVELTCHDPADWSPGLLTLQGDKRNLEKDWHPSR